MKKAPLIFKTVIILVALSIHPKVTAADSIAVGANAPAPTVNDETGKAINLAKHYKQGTTLLFFYPKANPGVLSALACSLRDNMSSLKKRGIKVIGISMDKAEDQKKFKDKNNYTFPLIADTEGVLVKAFGVKLFTPKICARESFLIRDGKIAWIDRKVSPKTHTEKVLAAADALTKKK